MAHCLLCGDTSVPDYDLLNHLRVLHPDVELDIEYWPDGSPVIHDAMDDM